MRVTAAVEAHHEGHESGTASSPETTVDGQCEGIQSNRAWPPETLVKVEGLYKLVKAVFSLTTELN